jgi:hypothetical protein
MRSSILKIFGTILLAITVCQANVVYAKNSLPFTGTKHFNLYPCDGQAMYREITIRKDGFTTLSTYWISNSRTSYHKTSTDYQGKFQSIMPIKGDKDFKIKVFPNNKIAAVDAKGKIISVYGGQCKVTLENGGVN